MSRLLREARESRGWSSAVLRRKMIETAGRLQVPIASDTSLRVLISRWENGRASPDRVNKLVLCEVFGLDGAAIGFDDAAGAPSSDLRALVVRTATHSGPSAAVIEYFDHQLSEHARMDNMAGPGFVVGTTVGQLEQLEQLAANGAPELARLASRYSEFAGWLYQDLGDDAAALELTNRAVDLADVAADAELATYNRMRKANVLTSANELHSAAATAQVALRDAVDRYPQLVPVCLRQTAVTGACLGDERGVRDALEQAASLTTAARATADGKHSSYCTSSYIEMEAAWCFLVLRRPAAAEEASARALEHWPDDFLRDRALCLARRGIALVELSEFDEACRAAVLALDGVRSAPSGRAVHMLRLIAARLRPLNKKTNIRDFIDSLAEVA